MCRGGGGVLLLQVCSATRALRSSLGTLRHDSPPGTATHRAACAKAEPAMDMGKSLRTGSGLVRDTFIIKTYRKYSDQQSPLVAHQGPTGQQQCQSNGKFS